MGMPRSGALDAPPASLSDDTSFLNGVLMEVDAEGNLPALAGKAMGAGVLTAPPYSYGFAVFNAAGVVACAAA